jgi:hypothetical protein
MRVKVSYYKKVYTGFVYEPFSKLGWCGNFVSDETGFGKRGLKPPFPLKSKVVVSQSDILK